MKTFIAISVALIFAACAPKKWEHATSSPSQTEKDKKECRYEADKATASNPSFVDKISNNIEIFKSCMAVRGYR